MLRFVSVSVFVIFIQPDIVHPSMLKPLNDTFFSRLGFKKVFNKLEGVSKCGTALWVTGRHAVWVQSQRHFSKQINTKKCQQITLSKKYENCWSVHASFMHCAIKLKRHISVQKSSSTAFLLQNKSSRNPWLPDFKPLNNWHCREKKNPHSNQCVEPSTGSVDQHMNTGIWVRY